MVIGTTADNSQSLRTNLNHCNAIADKVHTVCLLPDSLAKSPYSIAPEIRSRNLHSFGVVLAITCIALMLNGPTQ
jgi:hypothetical protein